MISSYNSSFSCSLLMSSLCRSNSKNSGSRGGATGSSSGSCYNGSVRVKKIAKESHIHMPQGMGEPRPPRQSASSWGQRSRFENSV